MGRHRACHQYAILLWRAYRDGLQQHWQRIRGNVRQHACKLRPPRCAHSVCTLTFNQSSAGTCFNVTAQNVTILCNGFSITGNNSSSTYGIISTAPSTTVKDCYIQTSPKAYATMAQPTPIQTNHKQFLQAWQWHAHTKQRAQDT